MPLISASEGVAAAVFNLASKGPAIALVIDFEKQIGARSEKGDGPVVLIGPDEHDRVHPGDRIQ